MGISAMDFERVMGIVRAYEGRIDKDFKIPQKEYEERYQNVWKKLDEKKIDMGFFFWYREMPGDGIYLTGYNPTIERASGVIAPGNVLFFWPDLNPVSFQKNPDWDWTPVL